jgi:hypothetical protein
MDSSSNFQLKQNALQIIQNYRVPDLQALLKYARLSQQGNKRELLQRCKILLSSNISSQLYSKINQIEITRLNATKSHNSSSIRHSIVSSPTSSINILPSPNHIQYVHLPFYERMRVIDCINIPVDWSTFTPLRFILTDFDVDLIVKGLAKVFLRIVPTILAEKQNDVLPPYLLIQCNSQIVINNNIAKTVGSQAHTIIFPTDITDKLILKSNIQNTLNYFWIQSPIHMSFKNLPKSYTLSIQLVRSISLDHLVSNIIKREIQVNNNHDSDIEIEDLGLMTTRHRVSLICPITQALIHLPVKSSYCLHLACFDLRSFLQMNEKRVQWTCPICKKSAAYETLHVDKRLQSILLNVPPNCSTVEIDSSKNALSDCQYILDNIKQETTSSQDEEESVPNSPIKSRRQSNTSDCIVLSSEDEIESNVDEGTYWEDIARITHSLLSDNISETRKRSNSTLSDDDDDDDDQQQHKRIKQSRTDDIELITLSSSDSDDQLF